MGCGTRSPPSFSQMPQLLVVKFFLEKQRFWRKKFFPHFNIFGCGTRSTMFHQINTFFAPMKTLPANYILQLPVMTTWRCFMDDLMYQRLCIALDTPISSPPLPQNTNYFCQNYPNLKKKSSTVSSSIFHLFFFSLISDSPL